jgi:hypothetical protein
MPVLVPEDEPLLELRLPLEPLDPLDPLEPLDPLDPETALPLSEPPLVPEDPLDPPP